MAVANVRTPRDAWIRAALQALASGGPDAVRIEVLAESLGVSKGGFYWHFTDRQALLDEMLDTWERSVVEDVIAAVESRPAAGRAKLQHLFELALARHELGVELALRDWSRRDHRVAKRLHRVDNRRMAYLRSLFGELCDDANDVEARSLLAFSLYIGSPLVMADHGDKTRPEVLQHAVDHLLSARTASRSPTRAASRSRSPGTRRSR